MLDGGYCAGRTFEMISDYCDQFSSMVPVGFVLGFFVTMVVSRWWEQFNTIPWPQNVALLVSANLQVHQLPTQQILEFKTEIILKSIQFINPRPLTGSHSVTEPRVDLYADNNNTNATTSSGLFRGGGSFWK